MIESIAEKDFVRAFSGDIKPDLHSFTFKECPRSEPTRKGEVYKIALGFRKYELNPKEIESVDYRFHIIRDKITITCHGHRCGVTNL